MSKKQIIQKAVKKNVPPERTFGTDPNDPWSVKSHITEATRQALLDKYLYAKGINPKFVTKDVRISHSKSGPFLKYQRDHMNDPDPKNANEEVEPLEELNKDTLYSYSRKAEKDRDEKERGVNKIFKSKGSPAEANKLSHKAQQRDKGLMRADDRLNREGYEDPQSATMDIPSQSNGGTNGADLIEKKKPSKAAQLIKSIFKKKLKEDTYDHEKASKSVATYGKKDPQFDKKDEKKMASDDETNARAVLKGGTTMTGEKRDTIIIDPSMKKPTVKGMNKQPDFPEKDQKSGPR